MCGWELLALVPGSPIPTISHTVSKYELFGVALLAMLAHHWYVESGDQVLVVETFPEVVVSS
jgi:hypothetical protein